MSDFYDKRGNAITLGQWSKLHNDLEYKRIGDDYLDKYRVSTVWLGLNQNFMNNEKIATFETMVFLKNSFEDVWCQRYATEEEAIAGHNDLVESIKEGKEISYDNQ